MATGQTDLAAITARLEGMERRMRLWRGLGIATMAIVGLGAVLARSQQVATARPAPAVITAQQFVVRDAAGVARAVLDADGLTLRDGTGIVRVELKERRNTGTLKAGGIAAFADGDWLKFYDVAGRATVELTEELPPPDFLQGDTRTGSTANLVLLASGSNGETVSAANLGTGTGTAGLWLTDTKLQDGKSWPKSNDTDAALFIDGRSAGVTVNQRDSRRAALGTLGGLPSLDLADPDGYSAVVGVTGLDYPHTGKTERTSAASIVLFDNKMHPIWRVPNP